MEKILAEIAFYKDAETETHIYSKISGTPKAGCMLSIIWKDRQEEDYGYCFRLPIQDDEDEMLDLIVHVTQVDNSDGIGKAPEEWTHLLSLLENDRVEKVVAINKHKPTSKG